MINKVDFKFLNSSYMILFFEVIAIIIFSIFFILYHNFSLSISNFFIILIFLLLFLAIVFVEFSTFNIMFSKMSKKEIFKRIVLSYTPLFLILCYGLKFFIKYYLLSSLILFVVFLFILFTKIKLFWRYFINYIKKDIDIKLFFNLFLFGLLFKLLLMPFFYHGDFIVIHRSIHLLIDSANFNLYNEIVSQIGNLWYNFVYYPLTYIILGLFYGITKIFLPKGMFPFDFQYSINAPVYIFLAKVPYLFFDILISVVLLFYFKDRKKSFILFLVWWFNPIVLYSAYIFSQFDIIVTFFIILGVYLLKSDNFVFGNLTLGLGASLKMFPVIFFPGLFLNITKKSLKTIFYFIIGIIPIAVSILLFYKNVYFKKEILENPLFSSRIYEASIQLLNNEKIYIFIFFYLLIFFFIYYLYKLKKIEKFNNAYVLFIIVVSFLFFALNRFSVHYTMWILPFVSIVLVEYDLIEILVPYIIFMFLFLFKWGSTTTTDLLSGIFNLWFKF